MMMVFHMTTWAEKDRDCHARNGISINPNGEVFPITKRRSVGEFRFLKIAEGACRASETGPTKAQK
jgi:hypothetical protein